MCQMMLAAVFLPSELTLTHIYYWEIQYLLELKKVRDSFKGEKSRSLIFHLGICPKMFIKSVYQLTQTRCHRSY